MEETRSDCYSLYCYQLVSRNIHVKDFSKSFKEFGDISMPYETYNEALTGARFQLKEMLEFEYYSDLEFYCIIKKIHKL